MNIFMRELKANFKSLVIWSGIIILFILIATAKFASFEGSPEMLAILDSMPPALIEAMSMNAFNLTTISGFYGVMLVYFALMGAIAAAMWGSDIISKEERDKTVEFSLVLPVSRSFVITAKALAALVYCLAFALITWGISWIAVQPYKPDYDFWEFLALEMLGLFLIELIFLAVGLLLGCALKQYKRASMIAVGIILGTYFLSVVSELDERFEGLNYLTPFKYFDSAKLMQNGKIETLSLALTGVIVITCVIFAYAIYQRRDLSI